MSDINYTEPHPLIAAAIERWNDHVDPGDDDSRVKVAWGLHWRDERQLEGGPACGIVDGGALLAYRGAEFEMLFGTDTREESRAEGAPTQFTVRHWFKPPLSIAGAKPAIEVGRLWILTMAGECFTVGTLLNQDRTHLIGLRCMDLPIATLTEWWPLGRLILNRLLDARSWLLARWEGALR